MHDADADVDVDANVDVVVGDSFSFVLLSKVVEDDISF